MRFSLVVPFFNEERYIADCVSALIAQDYPRSEFEIILVNNDSTDSSLERLTQFSDLKILNESKRDAYLARNRAIEMARGEIIIFTDADCVSSPGLLSSYDRAFSDPMVDIAVGRLSFPSSHGTLIKYYEDYYATKMRLMASELPRETCYGHAGNMAVRTRLFNELGLFSPMPIVGDAELVQKYLSNYPERRISYIDSAEVTHMEVVNTYSLLKKLYRYGIYSQTFSRISSFRVANFKEKLTTLKSCMNENNYSAGERLALLASLVAHYAAFAFGCFRAKVSVP